MIWRVGMKVVCINGVELAHPQRNRCIYPETGAVYTIRAISPSDGASGGVMFLLHEISNPIHRPSGHEYAFNESRFRPLVSTKTDISIFTRILDRVKRGEAVDA